MTATSVQGFWAGSLTRVGFFFSGSPATVGDSQRLGVLGRLADEGGFCFTPPRYRVRGGGRVGRLADSPQPSLSLSPCSHDIKKKDHSRSCLLLALVFFTSQWFMIIDLVFISLSLHLGIEKKKHVNSANCFLHPPFLLTSSLSRIKRASLTPQSQTCMFAIFATGVFLLRVV